VIRRRAGVILPWPVASPAQDLALARLPVPAASPVDRQQPEDHLISEFPVDPHRLAEPARGHEPGPAWRPRSSPCCRPGCRPAAGACRGCRMGLVPDAGTGSLSPSSGRKVFRAPLLDRGGVCWSGQPPPGGERAGWRSGPAAAGDPQRPHVLRGHHPRTAHPHGAPPRRQNRPPNRSRQVSRAPHSRSQYSCPQLGPAVILWWRRRRKTNESQGYAGAAFRQAGPSLIRGGAMAKAGFAVPIGVGLYPGINVAVASRGGAR
jgi:hypothetical protein